MKHVIIVFLLFSVFQNIIQAQEDNNVVPKWILEAGAGFDFTPNGNTYGLIIAGNKPVWHNHNNNLSIDVGVQGNLTIKAEGGFDGTYGTTVNTGIHIVSGTTIYLLHSKRFILKPQLFCGWSYKSTNMGIDNESLNIHQSYTDSYHYLARGIYFQAGYAINRGFILNAFIKADLRRLTDGDGILEYPALLYGVGIAKRIN